MTTLGVVLLVVALVAYIAAYAFIDARMFTASVVSIVMFAVFLCVWGLVLYSANRCVEEGQVAITGQRCESGVCSTATWTETRCVRRASDKTAEAP